MTYLSKNPYRVLGVPSNASLKDVHKNVSKLKAYSKIGKEVDLGYNLSSLNLDRPDRSDNSITKSENQLNLDINKLKFSLFWFANISTIDSVALSHLSNGEITKAIEIWDKVTNSKKVNLKNYSSFNNLSTLLIFNALDDSKTDSFKKDKDSIENIKKAINLKNEFILSSFFENYCESIIKTKSINSNDAEEFFNNTILDLLSKKFNSKELLSLFEDLSSKLNEKLNISLTEEPISNIKSHINDASNHIKLDKKSGIKVGKKLIKDTRNDIKILTDICKPDDFQFQSISNKLANQILQCGIVCFNETGDDQDFLSSYNYALSIAKDDKTKNRAEDCIKHCKEEKKAMICSSCNVNSINRERSFPVIIYKVTERSYRSVRFNQLTLDLNFCDKCLDDIESSEGKTNYFEWIASIIIGIIVWAKFELFILGLFGWFLGLGFAYWIGDLFRGQSSSQLKLKNHPTTKKLFSEGWQSSKPTA